MKTAETLFVNLPVMRKWALPFLVCGLGRHAESPKVFSEIIACSAGGSGTLDTILGELLRENSAKVTPGQEAALLAHCSQHCWGDAPRARDVLEEESMLAGLGVISPDEIGGRQTLE